MNTRNENLKYFSLSILFLILSRVVAFLFRLVARIMIARYSTSEIYGVFSVIYNEMSIISLVALVGLGQLLTIELPRKNNPEKSNEILSSFIYSIILSVIISVIALIFNLVNFDSTIKYSMIISIFFIFSLLNKFILIGLKDFFGVFLLELIQNLTLLSLIVVVRKNLTINNIVYVLMGSIAFSSIVLILYIFIRHKPSLKNFVKKEKKIFNFPKKRFYLFGVDIADSLVLYLLLKLPQLFLGSTYAGYVNIAFSIMSIVLILPQIVTIALGPLISQEYALGKYDVMHNSFRISMSIIYSLYGIILFIFTYFGNPIIELLYGSNYSSTTSIIFYLFLFSIIVDSFSYPFGLYLRNTDNEIHFGIGKFISTMLFVVFGILLLFLLENMISITIAYLISKVILTMYYFYSLKRIRTEFDSKDYMKLVYWLIFTFTSFILAIIANYYITDYGYRLLIMFGHLSLYIIYILLLKIVNLKGIISEIRIKILNRTTNKTENK